MRDATPIADDPQTGPRLRGADAAWRRHFAGAIAAATLSAVALLTLTGNERWAVICVACAGWGLNGLWCRSAAWRAAMAKRGTG